MAPLGQLPSASLLSNEFHIHSYSPSSQTLHSLKVHMEITIRGLSCSIFEAICPNCHLSISCSFHSLMSLWSKAFTLVSLLWWKRTGIYTGAFHKAPLTGSCGPKQTWVEDMMQYWTAFPMLFWNPIVVKCVRLQDGCKAGGWPVIICGLRSCCLIYLVIIQSMQTKGRCIQTNPAGQRRNLWLHSKLMSCERAWTVIRDL